MKDHDSRRRVLLGLALSTWLAGCAGPSAPAAPLAVGVPQATPGPLTVQKGTPSDFVSRVVMEDTYPERRVAFPDDVTGLPDLIYASVPGFRPLKLDLFLPPTRFAAQGPRPFVVYLHGGGFMVGTPRMHGAYAHWPEVLASLAAKGYVVASVSYRFAGEAPFPAAEQDVKASIRWLRDNAGKYGVDKTRGLVWGSSAGGLLAALTGVSCGVAALEPPARPGAPTESTCVQGAVSWFGVSDLTRDESSSDTMFLRCTTPGCSTAELARLASPVSHVDAGDPPILLVHGDADKQVSPDQSRVLDDAFRAKGARSELLLVPGVDHAFLGDTAEATESANRKALERTFAFIDQVLRPRP